MIAQGVFIRPCDQDSVVQVIRRRDVRSRRVFRRIEGRSNSVFAVADQVVGVFIRRRELFVPGLFAVHLVLR